MCRGFHNCAGDFTKVGTPQHIGGYFQLGENLPSLRLPGKSGGEPTVRSRCFGAPRLVREAAQSNEGQSTRLVLLCARQEGGSGARLPPSRRRGVHARRRSSLGPDAPRPGHLPHRRRKMSSPWEEDAGLHRPPRGRAQEPRARLRSGRRAQNSRRGPCCSREGRTRFADRVSTAIRRPWRSSTWAIANENESLPLPPAGWVKAR